jgi:hypothetical protein
MRTMLASFLILLLLPAAREDEIKSAVRDFGLIGTWAPVCAKAPAQENRRTIHLIWPYHLARRERRMS